MFGDDEQGFRYTPAEARLIARLATVRLKADAGNRAAKAQIAGLARQLAALKKRARKGDARAARAAQVLEQSGLFVSSQTFAMEGTSTSGQLHDEAFILRKQAAQLHLQGQFENEKVLIAQADALEKQAWDLEQAAFAALPKRGFTTPTFPWIWSKPWAWHVGRVNVTNVALLGAAIYLALKKRPLPAAVPAAALGINLALGARFYD